ncbi:MAG: hypothetical protein NVS2B15_19360 [Pseudarthrobacter sp.]
MDRIFPLVMSVFSVAGIFCVVVASATLPFAIGLTLLSIGAGGLSAWLTSRMGL